MPNGQGVVTLGFEHLLPQLEGCGHNGEWSPLQANNPTYSVNRERLHWNLQRSVAGPVSPGAVGRADPRPRIRLMNENMHPRVEEGCVTIG